MLLERAFLFIPALWGRIDHFQRFSTPPLPSLLCSLALSLSFLYCLYCLSSALILSPSRLNSRFFSPLGLGLGLPLLHLLFLVSSPLPHLPYVFHNVFVFLTAALGRRQSQHFGVVVSATMRCARLDETTRLNVGFALVRPREGYRHYFIVSFQISR